MALFALVFTNLLGIEFITIANYCFYILVSHAIWPVSYTHLDVYKRQVSFHPCNTLVFPGLELRLKERTVHRNGELISMTHREFATLVYLANHPSWVFSAGQIYEEVWGEDGENCGTAVASVIGQIRRKLTPDMPKAGYIRTVLGSGYKFEVPQGMAE